MTKYNCYQSCNRCGLDTKITNTDGENGVVYECQTECRTCGFKDFWAHGFFKSGEDGFNKSEKYGSAKIIVLPPSS